MNLPAELKNHSISKPTQQNLAHWRKIAPLENHSSQSGVNPLVDHSAAIFEHIYALMQQPMSPEIRQAVAQCLESLQKQFQQLEYSQDMTLAAHYALCATLDDIVRHHTKPLFHASGNTTESAQFLQNFHQSRLEQEKFYSILEHISTQPEKYVDLLELMYLCLRFGYKGQYRNTPFGLQQWMLLTDNIYRLIVETRGQHRYALSSSLPTTKNVAPLLPPAKKRRRFYMLTSLGLVMIIIAIGFIFKEAYNAIHIVT